MLDSNLEISELHSEIKLRVLRTPSGWDFSRML